MSLKLNFKEKRTVVKKLNFKQYGLKLCIFSHFNSSNSIEPYVVQFIKSLYILGYEIVFVTTSDLKISQTKKITKCLKNLVVRKNIGYDFISYKVGLSYVKDYKKYESILFVNDSIIFPLYNPKIMFDAMNKKKYDIWGMTSSNQYNYHIQSFFLSFNKKIIKSKAFYLFWNSVRILNDKQQIIDTYELGLTKKFTDRGFRAGAYFFPEKLQNSYSHSSEMYNYLVHANPFSYLWNKIILDYKVPFVKKNILINKSDQYNITTKYIGQVIEKTAYDMNIINRFLQKVSNKNCEQNLIYKNIERSIGELIEKVSSYFTDKHTVIYGANNSGFFLSSIYESEKTLLVDRSFKRLNLHSKRSIYGPSILAEGNFDFVLVCALSKVQQESIKEMLFDFKVEQKKIVVLSELDGDGHFNLERLLKWVDMISIYNLDRTNYKFQEYFQNNKLLSKYASIYMITKRDLL